MLHKKFACAFSFVVALFFQDVFTQAIQKKQENVIILWDIHDVMLTRDAKKIFSILWHDQNTWKTLRYTKGRFFGSSMKLLWKYFTSEASTEQFIHLAKKEKNEYFIEFLTNICNAQKPIEGTVAIIKELCENGYTHHIGSNIGKTVFDDLINPNRYPQFAELFACFDLDKSHVVTHNDGNLVRKPRVEYFQEYIKKNTINLNTTRVIFVDDRKENIDAAQKVGLTAIHFKNPEQLRTDLRKLGIELSAKPTAQTKNDSHTNTRVERKI